MIKQGVSFYSYQVAYRKGLLDMEGMVAEVAKLGCDGIELVPVMTPPTSYPKATDREIAAWKELMEQYHTRPVCWDSIIWVQDVLNGPPLSSHQKAGYEEQVQLMKDELTLCHQLGFYIMRIPTGYGIQMKVIEELMPMAEELGIIMCLEIHVPMTIKGEAVQNYIEYIARTGTKFAGLIPDMAIFASKLPERLVNKTLKEGGNYNIVREITQAYEAGENMAVLAAKLRKGDTSKEEELLQFAVRNVPSKVEEIRGIFPYIKHFHAKFYDVDENYIEHGIRFDKVVPELIRLGYDGYLNSEYEGQRMYTEDEQVDEVEQVRRQHQMINQLIR